jgi:hypothetical protein
MGGTIPHGSARAKPTSSKDINKAIRDRKHVLVISIRLFCVFDLFKLYFEFDMTLAIVFTIADPKFPHPLPSIMF